MDFGLLANTGDETFSPIWILIAALVIVAVAVALRLRNRK